MTQADDPKPDDSHGTPRPDSELARAYERIKSAGEELTRLDRLVSGLERGSGDSIRRDGAAEPGDAAAKEAPAAEKPSAGAMAPPPGRKGNRFMFRGLLALLLALGIAGAAFASRYGDEAKAIMARWAPQAPVAPAAVSERPEPAQPLMVQVADAAQQPSPAASASQKAPEAAPAAGTTASGGQAPADVAQSLQTIAHDLAGINDKLEQLKNNHEQTLREHADSIQQLKAAEEQNAKDNARLLEQVQALQSQLSALSAKASAPSVKKESNAAPRQHIPVAEPRRPPRRSRAPWMPPPDMVEPWDDPYW